MMNSIHCDDGSIGAPITSDAQFSSIIDDHHANFTMKGKNFKSTIQKQLQELGATFEEGMSVLEELQNTSYEKQKLHAGSFCVSDLSGGLAESLRDENRFLREIESKLRQRIEQLQNQLKELHGQLKTRPIPIDQQSHSDSQTNTVENKPELSRQNQTTLEVENAQLREELKAKMVEIEELRQQHLNGEAAMRASSAELESQLKELNQNLRQSEDCKPVLQKQLKQSEEEKKVLREKVIELEEKQKVVRDKDAEIVRLNSEMISLKGALMKQNAQTSALKTLQDQLTAKLGEIDALKQQLDNKTVEMETLRQQMLDETAEMTRVMEWNNEMKRSLRQAEDCKHLLLKRLKKNDQQAEELRGHIAELEKKQKSWSDACNDLDRVVKEKNAHIALLNDEMTKLRRDLENAKTHSDSPNPYLFRTGSQRRHRP